MSATKLILLPFKVVFFLLFFWIIIPCWILKKMFSVDNRTKMKQNVRQSVRNEGATFKRQVRETITKKGVDNWV